MLSDNSLPLVPERVPDGSIPTEAVLKVLLMDAKTHRELSAVPNVLEAGHAHQVPLLLKADALNLDSGCLKSALPDRLVQEGSFPVPEQDSINWGPRQL